MSRYIEIAPSILAADFRTLEREVKAAEDAGADRIHCDIMDGVFVPNISFGPLVVEAVKKCVTIPLDVHLMIQNPERYIKSFCDAGADNLTVHADACSDLGKIIATIHSYKVQAGVTVNPDKPISLFTEHLGSVDLVLIMSVFAGFGGQSFMSEMLSKVRELVRLRDEQKKTFKIEIDGGVNAVTAAACIESGVDVLVSGSYIFNSAHYTNAIATLRVGNQGNV